MLSMLPEADMKEVVDMLDIKLFLRVPSNILKSRREERQTYVLQSKSLLSRSPLKADPNDAAAGGVWTDPPNYFEQIVYPAYVKALNISLRMEMWRRARSSRRDYISFNLWRGGMR